MTRKDGHPVEESFTLQFGEAEDSGETDEVVSSADVVVDDHFMWKNASALLEEAFSEKADASPSESSGTSAQDTLSPDETLTGSQAHSATTLSFPDGNPMKIDDKSVDETLVADVAERLTGSNETDDVSDLDQDETDDDDDAIVVDERQVAMVSAPNIEINIEPDPDASLPELRADPTEAITRRASSSIDTHVEADEPVAGGLFADEMADVKPFVPHAPQGRKAPWVIYGTLGLGVAVVAVAAIGMVLQLREPQGPGALIAQIETDTGVQAANVLAGSALATGDVEVQSRVFRLAAGPSVDNESGLARSQIDNALNFVAPSVLAVAQPDRVFVADLGATLPTSVATVTGENFGAASGDTSVVTLSQDRIELDLSQDGGAGAGLTDLEVTAASTTMTVDPKISVSTAPELVAAETETPEAPADDFAALALYSELMTITDEIAGLDRLVFSASSEVNEARTSFVASVIDTPLGRAELPIVARFDVEAETRAAWMVPDLSVAPIVAVRLASADGRVAPDDRSTDSLVDVRAPISRPTLAEPIKIARAAIPEPNLPRPQIDVSGALLLAARAAEAEAARLRAQEAALVREQAAALKAAQAAKDAQIARDAEINAPVVETPVVEAPAVEEPVVEEPVVVAIVDQDLVVTDSPKAVEDMIVPVQAEIAKPAPSGEWVAQANWVPALGFSVSEATQNGRGVLEVIEVDESSVLPNWAGNGSSIVSVNGIAVERETAFLDEMLSGAGDATDGEVGATMMIRARPGLNPRTAKIDVPVTRFVRLGDGTELSIRPLGQKWVVEVVSVAKVDLEGLQIGDVLLRDFMTKSNLRTPMALEELFAAMGEAGETRVEFAVMRGGELTSGGVSLAQ